MRPQDLDHDELLELDPEGGVIRFAGQRALLIDAVAMGLLRKYLAENFGVLAARAVLTQFGFAHGFLMAEAMQSAFKWEDGEKWGGALERILALEGLFRVESGGEGPLSKGGMTLLASYEAEQHLLHFGLADAPMCWTICGLTSGYLTKSVGREIYVVEDRCLARGDAACHLIGRTREEWGEARAEELWFFEKKRLKDCLDVSLQRVTETLNRTERKLRERKRALVRMVRDVEDPLGLISKSPAMAQLIEFARRVAKVDATVLITGESGSGKERIARLLHEESTRASGPFIAINCGAITESLLETELFGHVRGAFTGATSDRPGLFEAAHGGSLLLDEVGEVSPSMQVKLLRALQEREIRRVGENATRRVDVRILAATNRNLAEAVAGGSFRQDLYYRLKVVELRVPPLRERHEDILPLARVLLADAAMRMQRKVSSVTPAAADQLLRYGWPGNVRELENALERAVALAHGTRVEREDLPEEVRHALPQPTLVGPVRPLQEIEREYILAALALNDGNQTRTAEQLRIGSATLYRKLKDYRSPARRSTARKRATKKRGVRR
jgi:two-component system response regulator HydG